MTVVEWAENASMRKSCLNKKPSAMALHSNFVALLSAKTPSRRHQHHEGGNPHDSRAIAVVWSGNHAADEGVAEQRQHDGCGQQPQIVEPAPPERVAEQRDQPQ